MPVRDAIMSGEFPDLPPSAADIGNVLRMIADPVKHIRTGAATGVAAAPEP